MHLAIIFQWPLLSCLGEETQMTICYLGRWLNWYCKQKVKSKWLPALNDNGDSVGMDDVKCSSDKQVQGNSMIKQNQQIDLHSLALWVWLWHHFCLSGFTWNTVLQSMCKTRNVHSAYHSNPLPSRRYCNTYMSDLYNVSNAFFY